MIFTSALFIWVVARRAAWSRSEMGALSVFNTLGRYIAAYYRGGATSWKSLARVIIGFPAFIALITLALHFPYWFFSVLSRISSTLVPVVMVAVGQQWRLLLERDIVAPLAVGLIATWFLTPLLAGTL